MANTETQSILVVGGGMSGLTAAIEAAEAGYDTYIVEKNPYLGKTPARRAGFPARQEPLSLEGIEQVAHFRINFGGTINGLPDLGPQQFSESLPHSMDGDLGCHLGHVKLPGNILQDHLVAFSG